MTYTINPYLCKGCGACAAACLTGAITVEDGKAAIDQTLCNQCGACVTVCPYGAISADSATFDPAQAGRLGRQMGRGKGRGGRGRW